MDLFSEPKPATETKADEKCSFNLTLDVPAHNGSNEMPDSSSVSIDLECDNLENKMDEEKLLFETVSNSREHFGCEGQGKHNEMNPVKKIKTEDTCSGETDNVEGNLDLLVYQKEISKEDKGILEEKNDFPDEINLQDDISSDGSNISSIETNSSGIGNDFESEEGYAEIIAENKSEDHKALEESSMKQFADAECSDLTKSSSYEKENEALENLKCEGEKQDKLSLANNENNISKEDKSVVSTHSNVSLFDAIKFPYKNPSNAFDVVVPLIGKNVIAVGDLKLFNKRYDLATEINRLKGIQDAPYMPKLNYHEWRKQRDARPQEEKDKEEKYEKFIAVKTAAYLVRISVSILLEMQNDNPNEEIIERCFLRFLRISASTLSLILSSQFVHVMMYIRGSSDFSSKLRQIANQCYMKCHVMFPIPDGYNFETVYTSEVVKNLPEQLNGMRNFILDYGDFEYTVPDSDDSAFSDIEDGSN